MKYVSVSAAVFILVFGLGISTVSAQTYLSGNFGAVFVQDADISDDVDQGELSFDNGFGVTGAIGHAYGNGLRTEIEIGYRNNDIDEIEIFGFGSGSVDGDVSSLSGMFNVFFDFVPNGVFTPFIGGGVGLANVKIDIDGIDDEDDTVFAYQAAAGGSFTLAQNVNLDLQYRYFATSDPDFDGAEMEYKTHNVLLGMRFSF